MYIPIFDEYFPGLPPPPKPRRDEFPGGIRDAEPAVRRPDVRILKTGRRQFQGNIGTISRR